jgi:carbamoyl-phosphate synthase large subunit
VDLGFTVLSTRGTHDFLAKDGIETMLTVKHGERNVAQGEKSAVDLINENRIQLVINTPLGRGAKKDGWLIRSAAVARGISCITTIAGFKAAIEGIRSLRGEASSPRALQEWSAS